MMPSTELLDQYLDWYYYDNGYSVMEPIDVDFNTWEAYCNEGLDELGGSQAEESDLATMCHRCEDDCSTSPATT